MESARTAAEEAALRFKSTATETDNSHIVGVIAGELASLEQLTRNSNERSTSAFEGIHGALTKIADRLANLELKPAPVSAISAQQPLQNRQVNTNQDTQRLPAAKVPFTDDAFFAPNLSTKYAQDFAPGMEAAEGDLGSLDMQDEPLRKVRTPSEMAQEAANAALKNINPQTAATSAAAQSLAGGELDDVPLSPGANVPDLNSILKRVRDQKKAAQSQVAKEVDRKDHFLSIKRAAHAAAAEVQQIEPVANAGGVAGNLKAVYAKFRRPILMIAALAVVAIAAIQLTSALVSSDAEQAPEIALQLQEPIQRSNATTGEPLNDTASVDPQPQLPVDSGEAAPRIVGAAPEEPAAMESASTAKAETMAPASLQPEGTSTETAIATSESLAVEPSVPAGFGPPALLEAAKTKDAKAQFEFGRRLAENQGDAAALTNAFAWFNASAAQGFGPAQYRVGNMYEKGLGVERSASQAKLWYQMAAEAGNASAMHNLAVLFASGVDGPVDGESALRWFQKAADLGVGDSQFNLGVMKGKGQGVPQDLEESYKWLAILAKTGDTEAAAKRDEVAKTMRPEQLASAKAKVELWKPQTAVVEANDLSIPEAWKIAGGATASVDVKKAVKNVQLILGKLGYNIGKPDGVMGENTRKAIRAFQKKEKLAVSGEIDGPLVKALLAKNG